MAPKPRNNMSNSHSKSTFFTQKVQKYLYFGTKISKIKFLLLNIIKHKNNFNLSQR